MPVRILALTVAALLATHVANADTFYVRRQGDDQNDGTTPKTAFRTVDRAAQVMNHGDDVIIGPGTYPVAATLAERFGSGRAVMQFAGDPTGEETGDPPGEVIFEPADPDRPILHLHRCRFVTVSDVTFRGQGLGLGLHFEKCRDVRIERCTLTRLGRGLIAEQTHRLWAVSTVVARNVVGIYFQGAVTSHLAHLTVVGNTSTGMLILNSSDGEIMDSLFASNNLNYSADHVSAPTWDSESNVITGATGPWGEVPVTQNPYEWSAASGQERGSIHVVPTFEDAAKDNFRISPKVTWAGGIPGAEVGTTWGVVPIRDRDGKEFTWHDRRVCVGAYDYPKPIPEGDWRLLPVKIEPVDRHKYPRQSAGIYKTDGTLVRTLLADATGVDEIYWDGLDDLGHPAPAGEYEVRAVNHDVRLVDDGNVGGNGPILLGGWTSRIVALPDGGFLATRGSTIRRFSRSGQVIEANTPRPKADASSGERVFLWGLALWGNERGKETVVAGVSGEDPTLIRESLSGEPMAFSAGKFRHHILSGTERDLPTGLAVHGEEAFVSLPALKLIRVINLVTGVKRADWPLEFPRDVAFDPQGTLWAISGENVLALDDAGRVTKTFSTGLKSPKPNSAFLAASSDRIAVTDKERGVVTLLDSTTGKTVKSFGKPREPGVRWTSVGLDVWRAPEGTAFVSSGQLVVADDLRIRSFWPETGRLVQDLDVDFPGSFIVHPTRPEFVYSPFGIQHVDPKSGRSRWIAETTAHPFSNDPEDVALGTLAFSRIRSAVLGGRPFLVAIGMDYRLGFTDVSDPLRPRKVAAASPKIDVYDEVPWPSLTFLSNSDLVLPTKGLALHRIAFKGLDADSNPKFDYEHPQLFGKENPPLLRGMKVISDLSSNPKTDDVYALASVDPFESRMSAASDLTGIVRFDASGTPLWIAKGAGENYATVDAVQDGKHAWIFGGTRWLQGSALDVYDTDGLRLATGSLGWPNDYGRNRPEGAYDVIGYVRADGRAGAYVVDLLSGWNVRMKLDGADTLHRVVRPMKWDGPVAKEGPAPHAESTGSTPPAIVLSVPKAKGLKVDGDWSAWEKAAVVPQVVGLPLSLEPRTSTPENLLQTFSDGTFIAAVAQDGEALFVYVVAADGTPHFDALKSTELSKFDGVQLSLERELFALSLMNGGGKGLAKELGHNADGTLGTEARYLPDETVWGRKLDDLSSHPLGRSLANMTGSDYRGKAGYALMARIPFEEVKLLADAARPDDKPASMTGKPGERLRIAFGLNCVFARGHSRDATVRWPSGHDLDRPSSAGVFQLAP